MLVTEDLGNYIRHYSDENYYIKKVETDELYEDAVDIKPCSWTYKETNIPIENEHSTPAPEDAAPVHSTTALAGSE